MSIPEIAIAPVVQTDAAQTDPIFSALPKEFSTMQWHGIEIISMPETTTILASNQACTAQAIRVGDKAWGVQFHPEVEATTLRDWMGDKANRDCAIDWLGRCSRISGALCQNLSGMARRGLVFLPQANKNEGLI